MADTKISALAAVAEVAGANEFAVNEAGTSKKASATQVRAFIGPTLIAGNSGAAGAFETWQCLTANAAANSTTTLATVMTTTALGTGTWQYEYHIVTQSAAITTGQKFAVNHTGTTTRFIAHQFFVNSLNTASNAIMDDDVTAAAGVTGTNYVTRTDGATLGITTDMTTANADHYVVIRGLLIVSASGSLELQHASEVAAASTVQAGTTLLLRKVN